MEVDRDFVSVYTSPALKGGKFLKEDFPFSVTFSAGCSAWLGLGLRLTFDNSAVIVEVSRSLKA
jgi:hypothetical protein